MQGGIRASLVCVSSLNYCRWRVAVMYVGSWRPLICSLSECLMVQTLAYDTQS
ncbi:MAG: Uncharacterised protein [Oceanospirillaceae bacterium UBA2001]|nr:MAG: Uncharacterised protein [Oceanospirillaceae bacterium UBA2001]